MRQTSLIHIHWRFGIRLRQLPHASRDVVQQLPQIPLHGRRDHVRGKNLLQARFLVVQLIPFGIDQHPVHIILACARYLRHDSQWNYPIVPRSTSATAKKLIGSEIDWIEYLRVEFVIMLPSTSKPRDLGAFFGRYDTILSDLLQAAPANSSIDSDAEDSDRLQLERGVIFPRFLLDPGTAKFPCGPVERLFAVASPLTLERITIVDSAGHARPLYRPLLVYSWLQAFRLGYELLPRGEFGRWEEATRVWCDELEYRLGEFVWPASQVPASMGDRVAEACWIALALQVAGKVFIRDAWTDLAADVFGKLARRQLDNGAFLSPGLSDNPETLWFHELTILHAAASYAVQNEDRALAASVARATTHHLNETQPDHATNQPWALFAFLWNPNTQPTADGMLHALLTQPLSETTLMLLADALYCIRLFGTP